MPIKVLIQMKHTKELRNALTASRLPASSVPSIDISGFSLDENYTPAKIPDRVPRDVIADNEVGKFFTFDMRPEASTYLIRGEVDNQAALDRLKETVEKDPDGVGVFADAKISTIQVCPKKPVGNYKDVAKLLKTNELQEKGMDGSNVMVAIMDTGFNMEYLQSKGVNAKFDASNSWTPLEDIVFRPGKYPKDHGTMCAFDVCISAPNCTLLDYALLRSQTPGGSAMDGVLSDAVKAFSKLLDLLSSSGRNKPSLVVSCSWGMFNKSWDFPVGDPGNYSDNSNHPFNIIVESLDDAGADILFAAGNCGKKCPDGRCEGDTKRPIYGANSHDSVLCIAGTTTKKSLLGYSSQGPGHLSKNKPDICAYTHFEGSGVYENSDSGTSTDSGTSAACPVAAGVIAAIRSSHTPSDLTPAQLRNIVRKSSDDLGKRGFDYKYGFGLINPMKIVDAISF